MISGDLFTTTVQAQSFVSNRSWRNSRRVFHDEGPHTPYPSAILTVVKRRPRLFTPSSPLSTAAPPPVTSLAHSCLCSLTSLLVSPMSLGQTTPILAIDHGWMGFFSGWPPVKVSTKATLWWHLYWNNISFFYPTFSITDRKTVSPSMVQSLRQNAIESEHVT